MQEVSSLFVAYIKVHTLVSYENYRPTLLYIGTLKMSQFEFGYFTLNRSVVVCIR